MIISNIMHGVTVRGTYRRKPFLKPRGRNQSQASKRNLRKRRTRMQKKRSLKKSRRKTSQMLVIPLFVYFKMTFRLCWFNEILEDYVGDWESGRGSCQLLLRNFLCHFKL